MIVVVAGSIKRMRWNLLGVTKGEIMLTRNEVYGAVAGDMKMFVILLMPKALTYSVSQPL
jgi:hypothetical protein